MVQPRNHFDRSKPFYPIVMSYIVQLTGFKEFALRAVTGPRQFIDVVKQTPALEHLSSASEADAIAVIDGLQKLMGPLQLRSEQTNGTIDVDVDDMAKEFSANINYVGAQLIHSAGNLLILAHELNKNKAWHDTGPLWEFLRHCRNGSAHGGLFHFRKGEPSHPASWGRFQIMPEMQGKPVFKGLDGVGLLSLGDPIRLLWDIEQSYPKMKA